MRVFAQTVTYDMVMVTGETHEKRTISNSQKLQSDFLIKNNSIMQNNYIRGQPNTPASRNFI